MDRLISAERLKETLAETLEEIKSNPKMDGQEMHIIAAIHTLSQMIDDAPTVWAGDDNDLSLKLLDEYERGKLFEYQSLGYNIDHLRELVQAEKDGRLVAPPCKVGDWVYCLWDVPTDYKYVIYCAEVKEIKISMRDCRLTTTYLMEPIEYRGRRKEYRDDDLGKTVFLTCEEAEAALEGGNAGA